MSADASTRTTTPITLLCGPLGSGKTTLVRQLLRNTRGLRIAVVENEYAETAGVERALATRGTPLADDPDLFVELPNGCVCCSVKDRFLEAVERLVGRYGARLDHVVVEMSGLADPGPVASVFWVDDELESPVTLDGVVCVVDAVHFPLSADAQTPELRRQIGYADRVIVNKTDAVSAARAASVAEAVRRINPHLRALATSLERPGDGDADLLRFVLSVSTVSREALLSCVAASLAAPAAGASSVHETHTHAGDVRALVLERSAPVAFRALRSWIGELLWESGLDLFRVKGVVRGERDRPYALQAVNQIMSLEEMGGDGDFARVAGAAGLSQTTLVLIGRGLDEDALRAGLAKLAEA